MHPDDAEQLATQCPHGDPNSQLVRHAYRELTAAGMFDPDADYDGLLAYAALDLIQAFSEQGHSGASATIVTELFATLARYEPLSPLTGEDDEWWDVSQYFGHPMWQNKRASHVFLNGEGTAYDIDGKVFEEPDGARFTSKDSQIPVEFPYTPHTEVVKVEARQ